MSSRPAWSAEGAQIRLHKETLSQKKTKKEVSPNSTILIETIDIIGNFQLWFLPLYLIHLSRFLVLRIDQFPKYHTMVF